MDNPETMIAGLQIMEDNLLRMIANNPPDDPDRLAGLQETLAEVRESKAHYELRLSPNSPGATMTTLS